MEMKLMVGSEGEGKRGKKCEKKEKGFVL